MESRRGFFSLLTWFLNAKAAVVAGLSREISAEPLLAMLAAPTMAVAVELSSRRDGFRKVRTYH